MCCFQMKRYNEAMQWTDDALKVRDRRKLDYSGLRRPGCGYFIGRQLQDSLLKLPADSK
jgi:hypothetical protein